MGAGGCGQAAWGSGAALGTVQARAGLGQVEGMHWHEGEVVMKEHARRKGCSLARWREGAAGRGGRQPAK